jgi:hypothetical protein
MPLKNSKNLILKLICDLLKGELTFTFYASKSLYKVYIVLTTQESTKN